MFSLRIVSTSHYQAEPVPDLDVTYSAFRSGDVKRVPILRIFGATPAGQKTCMHVHGVFPYLYVPYDGTQPLDGYLRRFAVSLDKAISVANNSNANTQHVFKISLVSGVPMYGYHADEQQFLKIYFYNPNSIRKAADLLLGGAVMNKSFQPHESHIPFPLQLFIDYNLYGMNLINVAAVKFRRPNKDKGGGRDPKPSTSKGGGDVSVSSSPDEGLGGVRTPIIRSMGSSFSSSSPSMQHWDVEDLPSDLLLPASVERQSVCELEVDVVAADILNRKEVTDNIGGNPGLAAIWEDERQRRRDAWQSSQITPQESQEHENVETSNSERELMQRLAEIIQQHHAFRQSESEESAVSMEDSMLTQSQSEVPCVPASQLEDHSALGDDSQSLRLSQNTVIVAKGEEDEMGDADNAPIISLESIQRVVSFSQSFSQSSSQKSATPAEGEDAADQSLVEVLAALAEESSPASSQRSAAQIAALEDQDSIVGHVTLLPDEETLQEDDEETLQMSQVVQEDEVQDENANFDLEGLDSTWDCSPDSDCVMKSDDDDDNEDADIPQLDGTSDEKPASASKSKKRLGVRGPVVSGGSSDPATGTSSSSSEQGATPPNTQPYVNYMPPGQQPSGGYPQAYPHQQQWPGDGGVMGRPGQVGHSHPSAGWSQSSSHPGQYPGMYGSGGQGQPPGNGYGYYPYPQPHHRPPFSQGQFSPGHATFSPPPRSPMSPSYSVSGSGALVQGFQQPASYPQSHAGTSPQHQGQFAPPSSTSQAGMAAARRHSVGSVGHSPQHSPGAMGWPQPQTGFTPPGARASPSGPMDSWSPPYSSGAQNVGMQQRESPKQQQTELQALLEAPSTSSTTSGTASGPASSSSAGHQYRRTMSADCSTNLPGVPTAHKAQSDGNFKLPEKRSGSFSGPSSTGSGMGIGSALSNLYNFVSNVDPSSRTPTPTSTITPSSTPNSAPSPSLQARDEEQRTYADLSSSAVQTSPLPPSPHSICSRSMSVDEASASVPSRSSSQGEASEGSVKGQDNPEPVVHKNERLGKQAKMKKLGLSLQRGRSASGETGPFTPPATSTTPMPSPCPAYTYTFHVPTPVFKRLKLQRVFPPSSRNEVKVVRMHPMDARRYSLLKIGSELVKVTRLSARELSNFFRTLNISTSATVGPVTGEIMASSGDTSHITGGPSRTIAASRRMVAGRIVVPKCKRTKNVGAQGSIQTGLSGNPAPGMRRNSRVVNVSDGRPPTQGNASQPMGNPQMGVSTSTPYGSQSLSGQTNTGEISSGANVPTNSGGQWQGQYMQGSQQPIVKSEFPQPSGTVHHQHSWGMGSTHANQPGTWEQGMGSSGQWPMQGQWQGGRYGEWQRSQQVQGSGEGFGYPAVKEEKSMQSPPPFQYPQASWSGSSSASSTTSSSMSSSQPSMSSPTSQPAGPATFPYPHPYSHNYQYNPNPYSQSASYSAHNPMNPGMSKFMPGAYHSPGAHHSPHYPSGHGTGPFPPGQYSPQYPGYVSPSGQQGRFGPTGSSTPGFPSQHNGNFSPPVGHGMSPPVGQYSQMSPSPSQHSPMSPPVSGSHQGQSPATISHRPQFFPPGPQQGQFSPPVHPHSQYPTFPGQQGQYPTQMPGGHFPQPVQNNNLPGFTPHSDASNIQPPSSQQQSFLTQGACQDTTSRATDPSRTDRPPSCSGPNTNLSPSSTTSDESVHRPSPPAEASPGLDASKPASESDAPTDSTKPPLDIAELIAMQAKRSKLKQTPEDFFKYQDISEDLPTSKKKSSRRDTGLSSKEKHFAEEGSNHVQDFTKEHEKGSGRKPRTRSRDTSSICSEDDRSSTSSSSRTSKAGGMKPDGAHAAPVCINRRRTTVERMSDCDSDDDSDDESDDSCEDYCPGKKIAGIKRKRLSKVEDQRTKRASVNYGPKTFKRFLREHKREKKVCQVGRRNSKDGKKKSQKLVEGVHYIVVGKFKGHRTMLVKVSKVKVTLNERVNVSEWLNCSDKRKTPREGSITRPSRLRKKVRGKTQESPFLDSARKKIETKESEDQSGFASDASTIIDESAEELQNRNLSPDGAVHVHKASDKKGVKPVESASKQPDNDTKRKDMDKDFCKQVLHTEKSEESIVTKGNQECLETSVDDTKICPQQESSKPNKVTDDLQKKGGKSHQSSDSSEHKGEEGNLENACENLSEEGSFWGKGSEDAVQDSHSYCPAKQVDPLHNTDNEASSKVGLETGTTNASDHSKPPAEDKDTGKAATADESPRSATPVSKQGKLLIDSPSVVYQSSSGELSQDADCSSLPHSNPESNSSSPIFSRLSFTNNLHSNGKDSEHFSQSKSDSKHLEQSDSEKMCPDTFCFQISRKVKETSKPLQDLDDDSSDSTNSNACFSDGACGDSNASSQPVSVTRKKKLSKANEDAETDKDRLKKQKQLTTNQRLGVAFLSKRRKKVKTKPTQSSVGCPKKSTKGERASSKLMNSLSALHMATLASLEDQTTTEDSFKDSAKFSENIVKVSENTLVVSENAFVVHEDIIKVTDNARVSENNVRLFENIRVSDIIEASKKSSRVHKDTVNVTDSVKTSENFKVYVDSFKESENTVQMTANSQVSEDSVELHEEHVSVVNDSKVMENIVEIDKYLVNIGGSMKRDCVEEGGENHDKTSEDIVKITRDTDQVSEDEDVVKENSSQKHIRQNPKTRKAYLRRKKAQKNKQSSKLMNSLSVLHMATLANLEDQPVTIHKDTSLARASDTTSDDSDRYQDSLRKMSYISPVESDKGDSSPPVPLTPEELRKRCKGASQRSAGLKLRLEENLGTCPLRVSELGVTKVPTTHIPLPSPYRHRMSKSASDSDSEGSVLSDTITQVGSAPKQSPVGDTQTEPNPQVGHSASVSGQSDKQSPRVLAEKTNCLAELSSAQESLNLKTMVSKPSAYTESCLSIRDLVSGRQASVSDRSENVHNIDDGDSTRHFGSYFGRRESDQAATARGGSEQQSLPSTVPLHVHVPDDYYRYTLSSEKHSPGRVALVERRWDSQKLDAHLPSYSAGQRLLEMGRTDGISSSEFISRTEPVYRTESSGKANSISRTELMNRTEEINSKPEGMSRTEKIISEMLGIDMKQAKDKPSPSSGALHQGLSHTSPSSPRGYKDTCPGAYREEAGAPSLSRSSYSWRQGQAWDSRPQDLSARTDSCARQWPTQTGINPLAHAAAGTVNSTSGCIKSPGASVSPGRYGVNGVDSHFARSLAHSPGSAAKSPSSSGGLYDYTNQLQAHSHARVHCGRLGPEASSSSRYGVSPRSLNEYSGAGAHSSHSPSKYAVSPRSVDEDLPISPVKHSSTSPGRNSSTSPGRFPVASYAASDRYSSISPGRYAPTSDRYSTSPARHPSTSSSGHVISPRSTQEYINRYSGHSPGRYGVGSHGADDRFQRHASYSPGRYSASPYSSDHSLRGYHSDASAMGANSMKNTAVSPGKSMTSPDKRDGREQSPRRGKQRSIGDYLDQMIESAFAELTPSRDKTVQPKLPEVVNAESRDKSLNSFYTGSTSYGPSQGLLTTQGQYSASRGTYDSGGGPLYSDKAIDLTAPKTCVDVHGSEKLTATSVRTPVVNHPTWTTVKTDNFENITDDEDDDVIPSSQEYNTNVYRFPGFQRLPTSTTSGWSSYSRQQEGRSSAGQLRNSDTSSEPTRDSYEPETYRSSLLKVSDTSRERSSRHEGPHDYHSSSSGQSAYRSYSTSPAKASTGSSYVPTPHWLPPSVRYTDQRSEALETTSMVPAHDSQMQRSFVTNFSTQWQDSQAKDTNASGVTLPNFEPITDSEDEEPNKSPRKSLLGENIDYSSAWLTHTGRAPYPLTVMKERSADVSVSSSQQASENAVDKTSLLPQSSVRQVESSSDWGKGTLDSMRGNISAPPSAVFCDNTSTPHLTREETSVCTASPDPHQQPYQCAAGSGGYNSDDNGPQDGGGSRKKSAPHNDHPSSSSRGFDRGPGHSRDPPLHPGDHSDSGMAQGGRSSRVDPGRTLHRYILCPRAAPPSRELVDLTAVSHGLSAEPATKAFCSNPADLPDRPRELGGRVLRIGTNRIAELEEVAPPNGVTGLRDWQTILAADSDILPSQAPGVNAATESLRDRLEQEPQLRYLLIGDAPCIITPVLPPPSHAAVSAWIEKKLQGLALDRHNREDRLRGGDCRTSGDAPLSPDTQASISMLAGESSLLSSSDEEDTLLFTKLKDIEGNPRLEPLVCAATGTVGSTVSGCMPMGVKDETEQGTKTSEATSTAAHSIKPDESEGNDHSSTPAKRQRLHTDRVMQSTPVRRSSRELFETGCTPIAAQDSPVQAGESGVRTTEGGGREEFVTPKRPPLRRLSTNTESALRRAINTSQSKSDMDTSQIDGPTPKNTHGFKVTQHKLQDAKALHKHQYLTVLSMELHIDTRGDLMPDPEVDSIHAVFYSIFDDIPPEKGRRSITGVVFADAESCEVDSGKKSPRPPSSRGKGKATAPGKQKLLEKCGVQEDLDVTYVASEADLLQHLIQLVIRLDPDILLGFEVQQLSWGFLLQRAAHLNVNLCAQIARIQWSKQGNRFSAERDEWGADHTSEIHIEGRIVLNLWRVLRHEVTLNIYSYENCAYHILHCRVPAYSFRTLTSWYSHRTHLYRWRVVHHYMERVRGQLAMLDQLDIIGKTSEFSRVFGIEFYDVLSRGSQYRVESMMLRLAKPLNFIPVSPGVQQRARQKAAECIPLNLEPESRFYVDPVVVLDFQSLYPSIMIAYNYCFSTCLGRLQHLARAHEGPIEFGCTSLNIPPETLKKLRKKVTISPNGCVFITQKVRRGVLPIMVEEILNTRLMVKKSMKDYKDDKTLHRMLDARQLGLKLIANVTYGYTGASYSGRMPCIEVGDSIVRKARESLERAIRLVEDTPRWQARVVYGDTDSMFIVLPGRTKDQAFVLGQEIADTVSSMFPKPMKLRFEKVYLPCVLQTKKRYVGFKYETRDQQQAVFDAKGIETVRRDNCGVVSKMLERCIKMLFTSRDVSLVRAYLQRQFTKMLSGRVGLQDYIFAKEYRGMMGYKPGSCVPALEIAKRRLKDDRRAEPRVGERVPYVIVHGSPGLPLIQLVRQPGEIVRDTALRINVVYYITKQVLPPLDRLFGLVGVNVFQWYNDMPKVIRMAPSTLPAHDTKQGTISQYFVTSDCLVCERQTKQPVCTVCVKDPQLVAVTLASRSSFWESVHDHLSQVCFTCMGTQDSSQPCVSFNCPVLFRRHLATIDLTRADQHREALQKALAF